MNYRPLVIDKLIEFSEEYPEYSIGELFYSMFTHANIKTAIKKSQFLQIEDKDLYTMIDKAIEKEKNDDRE